LRAVVLNCTLKPAPQESNTEALARVVIEALEGLGVEVELHRVLDYDVRPGVSSDEGGGDEWPRLRERVVGAEILVVASPTWLGKPSSVAQRVLERMDAMIAETGEDGRPIAYDRVAGVVVTGNEDGAHHVISEIAGALIDIGYTVPGQAWTYWNMGPGPGTQLPREHPQARVVPQHRPGGRGQPRRRRAGLGGAPHPRPAPAEPGRAEGGGLADRLPTAPHAPRPVRRATRVRVGGRTRRVVATPRYPVRTTPKHILRKKTSKRARAG
jgi:multimeric flavodoxin WrbA